MAQASRGCNHLLSEALLSQKSSCRGIGQAAVRLPGCGREIYPLISGCLGRRKVWRRRGASAWVSADATAGEQLTDRYVKTCLRCNQRYKESENGPNECHYHGHMTGDRGLFALAPPHQGVDGEWSDATGVIVYKWNEGGNRPNTGSKNWKRRWTCCQEYKEDAPPCRKGWHASYDDGATLF